ncbi:WYL domain-containing protein [Nocardioides sp. GY 10113]|uniref:WYL domain-containing protein n=1 Tax=Nocardioides sp. GY 10113 TaxID=2569761 RepID=UPI0010A845AE|nr:WYL domain-containing protein [Nocardioides sp. GY 10113]TIC87473.1 WYL domain-containing protein [Nocardioides sp. GY 10113]
MERLVRILAVLEAAGAAGVRGTRLTELAGFDGADPASQLSRDLRALTKQGWQIDNVGGSGESAVYAMTTVDNRLRVRLTPEQQTQLRRAVLLADRDDLVTRLGLPRDKRPAEVSAQVPAAAGTAADALADALAVVVPAVRDRAVLRFGYKGTPREVHPESVRNQNGIWYLRGVESEALAVGGPLKTYVVARMVDAESGPVGSAEVVASVRHAGLHPMTWEIDPPVDVVLRTSAAFEPDVRRWLGEPAASESTESTGAGGVAGADDEWGVRMTYRVTNRSALRTRLYELGRRVRIEGPADVRAEVLAELAAAAGIPADTAGPAADVVSAAATEEGR